jgi:hypothetical protein
MGLWSDLWKTKAKDWTYAEIPANKTPEGIGHSPVAPDSGYLDIFLHSARIADVRKGLSKFYGTVHSFISLPVLDGKKADFQVVTTPGDLKNIDVSNLDRVIVMNQRLLGPIPYRGGDLEIEMGLFSIKSADLAAPFLGVLESMSKAAGVSYVNAALPFVGPLKDGINLLAGADKDSILEIGLASTYQPVTTGYFVVMRAEAGKVDPNKFRIDNHHQLVEDSSGAPIGQYPYLVFGVKVSQNRDAWFMIPELAQAHGQLRKTIQGGDQTRVDEAFVVFKRTALTCSDLLLADAKQLVSKVEKEVKEVVAGGLTAAGPARDLRPLEKVPLYQ